MTNTFKRNYRRINIDKIESSVWSNENCSTSESLIQSLFKSCNNSFIHSLSHSFMSSFLSYFAQFILHSCQETLTSINQQNKSTLVLHDIFINILINTNKCTIIQQATISKQQEYINNKRKKNVLSFLLSYNFMYTQMKTKHLT